MNKLRKQKCETFTSSCANEASSVSFWTERTPQPTRIKDPALEQLVHRSAPTVYRTCQNINTTAEAKYFLLTPNTGPVHASSVSEQSCTTCTVRSVNTCTADPSAHSHGHQTMQECHNYTELALPYFKRAFWTKEMSHYDVQPPPSGFNQQPRSGRRGCFYWIKIWRFAQKQKLASYSEGSQSTIRGEEGGGSEESAWNNWRWSVRGEITVLTSWCLFIVSPACASLVNTNTHLVLELPVRIAGCTANWANGSYSWRQLAITLVICCSLFLFWLFLYVAPFNWDMVFDLQIYAAPLSGQNWTEF